MLMLHRCLPHCPSSSPTRANLRVSHSSCISISSSRLSLVNSLSCRYCCVYLEAKWRSTCLVQMIAGLGTIKRKPTSIGLSWRSSGTRRYHAVLMSTFCATRMTAILHQHQHALGYRPSPYHSKDVIRKHCHAEHTSGLSLAAVGRQLLSKGFSPDTHRIISWFFADDCAVFARAIHGRSQLLDPCASQLPLQGSHGQS